MSAKSITDNLRNSWVDRLKDLLKDEDEVLQTASGTLYVPVLDEEGNERWVKLSVIIPKDATEENGTDGYSLAKEYQIKVAEAEAKAKEKAEAKAKKIKRDAEKRAKNSKKEEKK